MLYLNCPKVINPSVHARYMQCAYKVHERIMQGSCKVHKRFMQGAYKQDGGFSTYGYGERAGSCGEYLCQISFKLAGQCDANMLQSFQCNGQLQRWQERGRACSRRWARWVLLCPAWCQACPAWSQLATHCRFDCRTWNCLVMIHLCLAICTDICLLCISTHEKAFGVMLIRLGRDGKS